MSVQEDEKTTQIVTNLFELKTEVEIEEGKSLKSQKQEKLRTPAKVSRGIAYSHRANLPKVRSSIIKKGGLNNSMDKALSMKGSSDFDPERSHLICT